MSLRRLLYALALVGLFGTAPALLTACNTIEGAGEDLTAAGRAVQGTAQETQRKGL